MRSSVSDFDKRAGRLLPLLLVLLAFGCSKSTPSTAGSAAPSAAPAPASGLTVGFIYVGPKDDYGYNQAHAEGAKAVSSMSGVKIREEEMVPETMAVQKTMEA
jgi:simple sugar transport system substrate-binding protein